VRAAEGSSIINTRAVTESAFSISDPSAVQQQEDRCQIKSVVYSAASEFKIAYYTFFI
jgi:hypothetical protein